jgi:hypothetical protein
MSFFACRYLDSIILPKTVKKIGKDAFGRTKVDNLEIDANNTYYYVDNNGIITADGKKIIAYTGKKKGGYEIPDGVEKIDGTYVFSLKSNLTSLTFPTSMNSISTYFDYCPGITDLFSYMTEKWCQATLMDWIKYNRIVLHVPIGYKEKYEDAYKQAYDNEWRGMGTVVEDLDPTLVDVDELLNQFAPENHCVYDLNGRRIPIHLRQNKQIYIINGRKVIN